MIAAQIDAITADDVIEALRREAANVPSCPTVSLRPRRYPPINTTSRPARVGERPAVPEL